MHRSSACSLAELESRLRYDLACLNEPPGRWARTLMAPDGRPMLDALVVGGGMCGMVAAAALRRRGLTRIRIVDRSPEGREGPWVTYARSEEHTSELQSLMRISYAVFCLKKKTK